MNMNICLMPGDGIGPEIVTQAVRVLEKVAAKFGTAWKRRKPSSAARPSTPLAIRCPRRPVAACKAADAVLLGAVGGPKWDTIDPAIRPGKGTFGHPQGAGPFFQPASGGAFSGAGQGFVPASGHHRPGLDIMVVRELTGGAYFGEPRGETVVNGERAAFNTMIYSESEIERIVRVACEIARKRGKKLCSVDKANVLDVSRLWREVAIRTAAEYPDVELSHMYVDNAAMQLIRDPSQFDVIVTENLFGDILSDEASIITGSIGMLPSASMGTGQPALFEPIHGSAPDIAGQDIANPLATILSVSMMLRFAFGLEAEAAAIDAAVKSVLAQGYRTGDIYVGEGTKVGCTAMGSLVVDAI
jgi:3-isopropylmalate dehydrogenase (EC 1.1.1.85)